MILFFNDKFKMLDFKKEVINYFEEYVRNRKEFEDDVF